MKISIIVAVSDNQVIGVDNQLPWHLPADLRYFKMLTTGHTIIMGRKTFDSIGRALPNRENIVITRDENFQHDGVIVKYSIEEAIDYAKKFEHAFIIGGDTIYRQTLHLADKLYITQVHTQIEGGTAFFPVLNHAEWQEDSCEKHAKDEKNEFDYSFLVYTKK